MLAFHGNNVFDPKERGRIDSIHFPGLTLMRKRGLITPYGWGTTEREPSATRSSTVLFDPSDKTGFFCLLWYRVPRRTLGGLLGAGDRSGVGRKRGFGGRGGEKGDGTLRGSPGRYDHRGRYRCGKVQLKLC